MIKYKTITTNVDAHCWLWGAPRAVEYAAKNHGRDRVPELPPDRPADGKGRP